ncbi:hypothetical protein F5879DRAFT_980062 [Lentinula edodes]|uniref:uncharacterized protein n=1 Tax=Lentinula edodes TaxID=5353 RepID=UPI001E8CD8E7|nr:uncharacterized protein C8R40DRAFT_1102219 [Lentinula edodes]KAH7875999.1 hypothetical protein C8R40DRAFT_1102219 [Lentinula edodes]KAJ3898582.1 hypothetical protein F5879DRAFT_980062 [Lentinula edodes]
MDANDTQGIQALLEQLQHSQAWKDAVASSYPDGSPQHILDTPQSSSAPQAVSVAALLSQLQTEPHPNVVDTSQNHHLAAFQNDASESSFSMTLPASNNSVHRVDDHRYLTFQQALPLIARKSASPLFAEALKAMKQEQEILEIKLSDERKAILSKYETRVNVAKTKASMIGSGISRHEANMLVDAFEKELKRFDVERVLPAWDGLVLQQQEALFQIGVPTMFATTELSEREKQQKIMQVLEGLI